MSIHFCHWEKAKENGFILAHRSFTLARWLHCHGPIVRQNIVVVGTCDKSKCDVRIQGLSWGCGLWRKNLGSMLGKASNGLGPEPRGSCSFTSWALDFSPPLNAMVISPKVTEYLLCDTLEISCVPFIQHCLISFLMTWSHCMVAFYWFCPISLWKL